MVKIDQIRYNLKEKGYLMTDEQIVLNLAKMMEEIDNLPRDNTHVGQSGERNSYESYQERLQRPELPKEQT